MEWFCSGENFPVKVAHLQRWSSLTWCNRTVPFHFQKFLFPVLLKLVTAVVHLNLLFLLVFISS